MGQKRTDPRRDLRWNVCIVGEAGALIGRCMTSNVSASGAKLVLQEPCEIPDQFSITFSEDGKVARHCEVAWRAKDEIGVRFTAAAGRDPL